MAFAVRSAAKELDWGNISFISAVHALGVGGIVYVAMGQSAWQTIVLAVALFLICHTAISGGYHRLYAHRSYKAHPWLERFYLIFGAATFQGKARWWVAIHRTHHAHTDVEAEDPHTVRKGLFHAHMGWLFRKSWTRWSVPTPDLKRNPLIGWQWRNYWWLGWLFGVALPTGIAALWGDVWGGLLVSGFTRLLFQFHTTWSINSLAHWVGWKPYDKETTATENPFLALLTAGEAYHNSHHVFPRDYRLGLRPWDLDPTKWFILVCSKVGLAWDLNRATPQQIQERLRTATA